MTQATEKLSKVPHIGKPVHDLQDYRDLYVKFGAAGFVIRYRTHQDQIYIVHIRHYREVSFDQ